MAWEVCFLAAVWCACAAMLRPAVRARRSMLPTGVVLWTLAYTLTRPPIYLAVDALLGGINVVNLLYRLLMLASLGCLEVMLLRATRGRGRSRERRVALITVAVALLQCALFRPGAWTVSSSYLAAYGGQLTREAFWNVLPLSVAVFAVHVVVAVRPGWSRHTVRATRWGIAMIGAASVTDLAWTGWNIAASAIRLAGHSDFALASGIDPVSEVTLGISAVLTGAGVLIGAAQRPIDRLWVHLLLLRSWPLWRRTVRVAFGSRSGGAALGLAFWPLEAEHTLYRRWVEMTDAQLLNRGLLRPGQRRLLATIEAALGADESPSTDIFDGLLLGQEVRASPETR